MMKILVIYYSFEGNTKLIAETISRELESDILELKPRDEPKSKGFMKYFWGGGQVIQDKKPELFPLEKDPSKFDLIFLGTPVWAFSYSPTLNSFLSSHLLSGKNVAIFCCHAGAKGKTFSKLKNALEGNIILGEMDFQDPLKRNTEMNLIKAREWAKSIVKIV